MADIVLDQVTVRFGDFLALYGINGVIRDGEIFVMIGSSGSGKSTLLKAIAGLQNLEEGHIWVDGQDITKFNKYQMLDYHKNSGYVFQNAALISNMNIYDNLALYYRYHTKMTEDEIRVIITKMLELFDFRDDVKNRPNTLSTGERMIVSVVRAISHDPNYLFWDEPMANLDSVATRKVEDLILGLREQRKTMLVVTHDIRFAFRIADRIGILLNGTLVQSGTVDEIQKSSVPEVQELLRDF